MARRKNRAALVAGSDSESTPLDSTGVPATGSQELLLPRLVLDWR